MKHTLVTLVTLFSLTLCPDILAVSLPRIITPMTGSTFVLSPFTGPITHTASLAALENWATFTNSPQKFYATTNTVELRQLESTLLPIHFDYEITVTGTLTYWMVGSTAPAPPVSVSLQIRHDPSVHASKVVDYYSYSNAYKSEFVIQSVVITTLGAMGTPELCAEVSKIVELNFTSQQTRYLQPTFAQTPKLLPPCLDGTSQELTVHWQPVPAAEEYEFEILHRDDYADNNGTLSPSSIPYDFKENSTRIVTKQTYYRVPVVYERGYLLYRVRAVGVGGPNWDKRIPCAWTGPSDGLVSAFVHRYRVTVGHMAERMNWQLSTTYSEEGKRKDVAQYYDGLTMSRQTITGVGQNRSSLAMPRPGIFRPLCWMYRQQRTKETVAQEVIYDFNGRPAIQILPIPTSRSAIEFIPSLNKNQQGNAYSWLDFDEYEDCTLPSDPLSSDAAGAIGAGAYYSPNNPNTIGFNAFVPDSKGYPFTRVQYTPDNTVRTFRQASVGQVFAMDAGHETRYFYAKPNQTELDRMFGTEVGYAIRYQKNMVVDPNGQVSVSYLNAEGKTIATALAGKDPTNMLPLDNRPQGSNAQSVIEVDLMGSNVVDSLMHSRTINEHFVVTQAGTYTFSYNIQGSSLQFVTCEPSDVCLDCIYGLEMSLVNNSECVSDPLFSYSGTFGDLIADTERLNVDLQCVGSANGSVSKPTNFPASFERYLDIGSYTLTKVLTVNKSSADEYVELAFEDTCRAVLDAFIAHAMALVDTAGCFQSCSTCLENTTAPVNACDELCPAPVNACDAAKRSMRLDVSPGGQYGGYDVVVVNGVTEYTAAAYPLSVFNPASALSQPANWQALTGKPDLESVILSWDPATSPDVFLQHHPEYCQLTWCESENTGKDYDVAMAQTTTLNAAQLQGLLNSSSTVVPYLQLLNADPFFASGYGLTNRIAFENVLHNPCGGGVSVLRMAMDIAYCQAQTQYQQAVANTASPTGLGTNITNPPLPCSVPVNYYPAHTFGSDPATADLEWQILRNLYQSYKETYLYFSRLQYSVSNDCYNGCVGSDVYAFIPNGPFSPSSSKNGTGMSPEGMIPTNNSEVCGTNEDLYKGKVKRFTNRYDAFSGTNINLGGASLYGCLTNAQMSAIQSQARSLASEYICDTCKTCPTLNDGKRNVDTCRMINPRVKDLVRYLNSPNAIDRRTCTASFSVENGEIVPFAGPRKTGDTRTACTVRLQNCDLGTGPIRVIGVVPVASVARSVSRSSAMTLTIGRFSRGRIDTIQVRAVSEGFPVTICPPKIFCNNDSLLQTPPLNTFDGCVQAQFLSAQFDAHQRYTAWVDSMKADLRAKYYAKCMMSNEEAGYVYQDDSYHYTLYYYDQAGNLVRTVPPSGVSLLPPSASSAVTASRNSRDAAGMPNGVSVLPVHAFVTNYAYNSLNQLSWQTTPDAGRSTFLYDKLGRIAASQNAMQQSTNAYSYTYYDKLGRVVESGKLRLNGPLSQSIVSDYSNWKNYLHSQPRAEITFTQYDAVFSTAVSGKFGLSGQNNLRGRVAGVFSFEDDAKQYSSDYRHATHYTYDVTGNVPLLLQDYPNTPLGTKAIAYNFDLVSGKVNEVRYSPGQPDEYRHRYTYDSELRLTKVESSSKGILWDVDAEYLYYRHGPLARTVLGHLRVQGLDYIYTLQGWVKGVNGTTQERSQDAGRDGIELEQPGSPQTVIVNGQPVTVVNETNPAQMTSGPGYRSINSPIAADAFGYVLQYYTDDYSAISSSLNPTSAINVATGDVQPLYNGNISRMYTWLQGLGGLGMNYRYDVLNRIKQQEAFESLPTGQLLLTNDAYRMELSYDGNGNILSMKRNGSVTNPNMDRLQYHYLDAANNVIPSMTTPPTNATNRLAYVNDAVAGLNYPEANPVNGTVTDVDNQTQGNYKYDAIGNLIQDLSESISIIEWNLQGKITAIRKSTSEDLYFEYDALGNRVRKYVAATKTATYYVRDAQGNIMATYRDHEGAFTLQEMNLYGSSRLGVWNAGINISAPGQGITGPVDWQNIRPLPAFQDSISRGSKQYELSNHLGNVLATVSDRRMIAAIPVAGTSGVTADVLSARDYYAFGMGIPGRQASSGEYRFGYNGKENDKETGTQDYGFRIYNPTLSKFYSVDPLTMEYPELTPYQFASNTPIQAIDWDGLEGKKGTPPTDGSAYFKVTWSGPVGVVERVLKGGKKIYVDRYYTVEPINCNKLQKREAAKWNALHDNQGVKGNQSDNFDYILLGSLKQRGRKINIDLSPSWQDSDGNTERDLALDSRSGFLHLTTKSKAGFRLTFFARGSDGEERKLVNYEVGTDTKFSVTFGYHLKENETLGYRWSSSTGGSRDGDVQYFDIGAGTTPEAAKEEYETQNQPD